MFDFLWLFAQSMRHVVSPLTSPSRDRRLRQLQWCAAVFALIGIVLSAWSITEAILFDFRDSRWYWLINLAILSWVVSGSVSFLIERRNNTESTPLPGVHETPLQETPCR